MPDIGLNVLVHYHIWVSQKPVAQVLAYLTNIKRENCGVTILY